MSFSGKIYDAVHGFIRFNEIERIWIDSEPFQRLHHLHQLGIAYLVFPGATHTRFEHSLGAMEVATQIFDLLLKKTPLLPEPDYWRQIIRIAALCHDVGHLPFSHDAEEVLMGKAGHEGWTVGAIQSPFFTPVEEKLSSLFPEKEIISDVLKMAVGEEKLKMMGMNLSFTPWERVLSLVLTGDFFGADRIDYLLRDAQCTGVSYGLFDYHQLIEMLCVISSEEGTLHLAVEENGLESCEALLLARYFMHKRVYQYSSVQSYKFHLCRFMKLFYETGGYLKDLESYLSLTDNEIVTVLRRTAKNPQAAGFIDADALLHREHRFRAIEIEGGISQEVLTTLIRTLSIPSDAISIKYAHNRKPQGFNFSVLTRNGALIPAETCSLIQIPATKSHWVYVAPDYIAQFEGSLLELI